MSETNGFEPKIIAYVCNWCTYLGADLAGTTRLEYPPNVRIVRLPCTGRIDFNLLIKAFEIGADAVLVSGCHPGDCHYTAGNYHARRRWILFRELLDVVGFDLRRIHFTWISAAEGRKFQEVITEITATTRELGPYRELYDAPVEPLAPVEAAPVATPAVPLPGEEEMRAAARRLLAEGKVNVVIGYGARGPVFVTSPDDVCRLVWNTGCLGNLTAYLKRREVRALGRPAVVVKGCDERALVVLEKENQIERAGIHAIGMACSGMGEAKCVGCDVRQPRFADETIGTAEPAVADGRWAELDAFLSRPRAERMAYWSREFDRCVKCYACRQSCPMCYCERCLADKNRPVAIRTSATRRDNFAWQIARAFHLAGRCVGCDACTRACPAGIDLRLLNLAVARAAGEHFGYRAGMEPAADLPIGSFAPGDKEAFIR